MWDLIVSFPDHCLSFYFVRILGSVGAVNLINLNDVLDDF